MARGFNYAPGASAEVEEAGTPGLDKDRIRELAYSRNVLVREAIARREDCPLGLMAQLVHDHDAKVRAALGANPRLLGSVVEHLARDRHVEVLLALCTNPATSGEVLEHLMVHKKADVRQAAAAALEARVPSAAGEDAHTPELRDRVFETAREVRTAVPERQEEHVVRVRTAPVRGFTPPVDA